MENYGEQVDLYDLDDRLEMLEKIMGDGLLLGYSKVDFSQVDLGTSELVLGDVRPVVSGPNINVIITFNFSSNSDAVFNVKFDNSVIKSKAISSLNKGTEVVFCQKEINASTTIKFGVSSGDLSDYIDNLKVYIKGNAIFEKVA